MGPTRWVAFLLLLILPIVSAGIFSDPAISYCKCICFSNSTIIPLWHPADTSKPCLSCTRQFCLDQKLPICRDAQVPELDTDVGTGTEGDVEARCFKRDSPRDQLVVTFFCLIIVGLLLFAAVRSRLRKAIDARGRPQDMREWSHALLPTQLHSATSSFFPVSRQSGPETYFDAGEIGPGTGIGRGTGDYEPVSLGAPRS